MKNSPHEFSYTVGKGYNCIKDNPKGWTEGLVYTLHGMVDAYAQGDANHFHGTQLRFQVKNRVYVRSFNKRYTKRGIARIAKQFSKDISEQLKNNEREA